MDKKITLEEWMDKEGAKKENYDITVQATFVNKKWFDVNMSSSQLDEHTIQLAIHVLKQMTLSYIEKNKDYEEANKEEFKFYRNLLKNIEPFVTLKKHDE